MAGSITVSSITLDSDNNFRILSNTGATLVSANGSGIVSGIQNTAISGVITAGQLATSLNLATNNVQVASIQTATGTPAITFAANGQMTLANTPLQLTGGQIKFPGTQIASADANTLDDYEEGTWTPVLSDGTNNVSTYYYQQGSYIKIGRQVFISCTISVFDKGSLSGSQIRVNGLPFAAGSLNGVSWETYTFGSKIFPVPSNQYPIAEVNSTSTTVNLFSGSAGNQNNIPASSVGGGSQVFFAGCYIV